jgi:thiamine-monophosphate kinase
MTTETALIESLRALPSHEGARGLEDDAAVLPFPIGRDLVLTKDMIVEGVHFLPSDPPGDVAWKLVAVNLSDLAAKGATPFGVLTGYALGDSDEWDAAFVAGLGRALDHFGVALLGGDTVRMPEGAPRALSLTALGHIVPGTAPDRRAAKAGDMLWVSGTIGDAGAGLQIARNDDGPRLLLKRYRLPMPRLALGKLIAPHVHAMMDVSDGLLIDAGRIAAASHVGLTIRLDAVPLSLPLVEFVGNTQETRLAAATAGDDYELLFTAPPEAQDLLQALAVEARIGITRIGDVTSGHGLNLLHHGEILALPDRLGYLHQGSCLLP